MKESDVEGLANHNGPELCGGGGNTAAEALVGVRAGTVLSPEIRTRVSGADRLFVLGRQHVARREGKECDGLAGSETRRMRGSNLHGNRETLQLAPEDCAGVRTVNSKEVRL
jgi:hypothetical protein